jgi:hypothetical protein
MYSLVLAVLLVAMNVALLSVALRRIAGWRTGTRPRLSLCVLAVAVGHLAAVPVWWLALPSLATDDDIGGPTVFFLTVWLVAGPALFFLLNRAPGRTAVRWLAFGAPVAVAGLFFAHVVERFVLETTRAAMVDTLPVIRNLYSVQTCPECGGEFVVRLYPLYQSDGTIRHDERFRKHGVCQNCYHTANVAEHRGAFYGPDHFVVNRLRAPERWRLVAFGRGRFPMPSRLVGLPGETIVVRDGAVWANGQRLEPPAALGPLRYTEIVPRPDWQGKPPARARMFAHPDEPLALGADEYFLLNDDSADPTDSRLDGPYHWKNYRGVVDLIFWPPARWRLLP